MATISYRVARDGDQWSLARDGKPGVRHAAYALFVKDLRAVGALAASLPRSARAQLGPDDSQIFRGPGPDGGPDPRCQRRQICRSLHRRRDWPTVASRVARPCDRHERARFDRSDRRQRRPVDRRADLEPLLDDRMMAVLTTCAMPPTLRWALARTPLRPGEQERLDREAFEAKGFVANMERFLVAASDHANGRLASRLAGLLAGSRGQPATVLHVQPRSAGPPPAAERLSMAADVKQGADHARAARPEEAAETPDVVVKVGPGRAVFEDALSKEAPKGYDFLIIGFDPAQMPEGGFNPEIAASARSFDGPLGVVIARGVHKRDPAAGRLKILAPIAGAANDRHAAEVAIELARAARAELTILFGARLAKSQEAAGARKSGESEPQ